MPVFTHKGDADVMFERLARTDAGAPRPPASGLRHATTCARWRRPSWRPASWACPTTPSRSRCCTAWASPIKQAVRRRGLRLREYAPVGELIPGMAYLVRRLLENTANDSRSCARRFAEGAAVDELIAAPLPSADLGAPVRRLPVVAATDPAEPGPFRNTPHADFARHENRDAFDRGAGRAARAGRGALPLTHRRPRHRHGAAPGVGRPGPSPAHGGGHGRLRRPCRGRSRRGRRRRRRCPAGATPRRASAPPCCSGPPSSCAASASRSPRSMTLEAGKSRPRSRRRRHRGHRLPGVLRPRDAAPGHARGAWATCPARTTATSTRRAAWPWSSPPGTSRWRSSRA